MTIFDYVVIGIVAVSLLMGLWRGVVGELIALAAWVMAFLAAVEFGGGVGQKLFRTLGDPGVQALAGFAAVFFGILVLMALVRMAAGGLIRVLGLSVSDRLLGLLFGAGRGLLIAMALVAAGGMTAAPSQPWWREASLAPPLETAVLAAKPWLPPDLAKRIRFK